MASLELGRLVVALGRAPVHIGFTLMDLGRLGCERDRGLVLRCPGVSERDRLALSGATLALARVTLDDGLIH